MSDCLSPVVQNWSTIRKKPKATLFMKPPKTLTHITTYIRHPKNSINGYHWRAKYLTQISTELSRILFSPPIYAFMSYQLRKVILLQVVSHHFWREVLISSSQPSNPVSKCRLQEAQLQCASLSPGSVLLSHPLWGKLLASPGLTCVPHDCLPSHPGYLVDPMFIFLQSLPVFPVASPNGNKPQRAAGSSQEQLEDVHRV